jgi:hypothetical protein
MLPISNNRGSVIAPTSCKSIFGEKAGCFPVPNGIVLTSIHSSQVYGYSPVSDPKVESEAAEYFIKNILKKPLTIFQK